MSGENKHDFLKIHFSKPTWCDRESCQEFIWGIGKQGYTCQKCGLAIHKRCHGVMSEMPCSSSKPITPVATTPTPSPNNNNNTSTTSISKQTGSGVALSGSNSGSSSSEEKKTIEPVTKARPPPKRLVSRNETQQILKNMPKTAVEKDIQVEKYTDLTMQRPKTKEINVEDNKGELEVVFNSIIQLFKLDEENKEWKHVDSGKSRIAIYYHTSKSKHRLIALSNNNNFILNSWISNKFVHKRLSERYFCISLDGDHVDFGINFGSKEPSEAFDKILTTIETSRVIKPTDSLVMTELEDSSGGGKRRWTGGASNLPLPQYSKSSTDIATPSNVVGSPTSTTNPSTTPITNTTANTTTTTATTATNTSPSNTSVTNNENTDNKTKDNSISDNKVVTVTTIDLNTSASNKEEEKLRTSSKVGQSPSVGRRRTGTSSSTSPSPSPINGSPVGSPSKERKAPSKEVDYEQIIMQMDDKKYQEENFNIKLKFFKNAYYNGETIEGELTLNLATSVSASSVAILFQGIEKAFNGIPGESPGQKSYESSQFFAHKVLLWQASGNNTSLDKKEYKWNFSFKLPEDLPPSIYFEDWLFTFYQARGYVEPANKNIPFPKIVSEAIIFDIYGLNESTWNATLKEAIPSKDSKSFKSDKIHINAHLKRDHFYVGEIVDIHLKISNSTKDTPPIKVDLFQCVNINANDFKKEFPEVKLFSQKFGDNASRVNKQEIDQMRIIEVPIPRYNYWTDNTLLILPSLKGKLFTISHYLKVRLDIPFSVDPAVILPLRLWDGLLDDDTATFQDAFLTMEQ